MIEDDWGIIPLMDVSAIIAAAGWGRRMESDTRKQYLVLEGLPVLARSLNLFLDHGRITEVVAVIPPGEGEAALALLEPYCAVDRVKLVEGGVSRQESVKRGLEAISARAVLVCVHDAARPLATPALLEALLAAALQYGAAVPVIPLADTVKEVNRDGLVLSTPDRDSLYRVQTPQVFKKEIINAAYRYAGEHNIRATDDASLVEAMGKAVRTVPGEAGNIKITSPVDLLAASLFLKGTGL